MKTFIPKTLAILLFTAILFVSLSCNKNNTFISAKKLKDKVKGTWYLQPLLAHEANEVWVFDNDLVTRYDPLGAEVDHGVYDVNPRINGSRITISGMTNVMYNGRWYIVKISKSTLQMTIDYVCEGGQKHCGIFQRDLYRK